MQLRPRVEVFCFRGPKVLAAFRPEYVVFPGGGVDPKETAIEAAKRECAEEAARRLINCNVAHKPTSQKWPDGYTDDLSEEDAWKKDYDGGMTYWMTGSCSEDLVPELKHKDLEKFEWMRVCEVLDRLKKDLGNGWDDDNKVRIDILEAHETMRLEREPEKVSTLFPTKSPFPVLQFKE